MNKPRIVLMGPMGIGKTTAIRSLCGELVIDCDVPNLDRAAHSKEMTTVGADFGEIDLGDGEVLQIYGCPGQERFDFVRSWLLSLSFAAVIMIDVRSSDAVTHTRELLAEIKASPAQPTAIVLIARDASEAEIERYLSELQHKTQSVVPLLKADPRQRDQLLDALEVLFAMFSLRSAQSLT